MAGTLYVVGTPIGNLSDLTFRAVTTLKAVDLIAAEDTRTSRKLLGCYDINTPLISYHDNNEITRAKKLVDKLFNQNSCKLSKDAYWFFLENSSNDYQILENEIIKKSEIMIRASADAYSFLQIAKNFLKILIFSSERKNENNIADLAGRYLPKYLFRQKTGFELAVARADLKKIRDINNLLQKAELYLRKNDSRFLIIIQRILLNFSKTIK